MRSLAKLFIRLFSNLIRHNKEALKYLFSVSLKNETNDYFENQYYNEYAHIDKAVSLAKKLKLQGKLIFDIGGANGKTASMFSAAFPESKIFTFEPIKENFNKIKELSIKHPNIFPMNKAIGNFTGKSIINIANRLTASSLLQLNADDKSNVFSEILKSTRTEEIEVEKLDNEYKSTEEISIIKIDVQGFELEVLKGAKNALKKTHLLILEVNNHEGYTGSPKYYQIDEFLRHESFSIYDIFPSLKDSGQLKEWDVIYIKNSHL